MPVYVDNHMSSVRSTSHAYYHVDNLYVPFMKPDFWSGDSFQFEYSPYHRKLKSSRMMNLCLHSGYVFLMIFLMLSPYLSKETAEDMSCQNKPTPTTSQYTHGLFTHITYDIAYKKPSEINAECTCWCYRKIPRNKRNVSKSRVLRCL